MLRPEPLPRGGEALPWREVSKNHKVLGNLEILQPSTCPTCLFSLLVVKPFLQMEAHVDSDCRGWGDPLLPALPWLQRLLGEPLGSTESKVKFKALL